MNLTFTLHHVFKNGLHLDFTKILERPEEIQSILIKMNHCNKDSFSKGISDVNRIGNELLIHWEKMMDLISYVNEGD